MEILGRENFSRKRELARKHECAKHKVRQGKEEESAYPFVALYLQMMQKVKAVDFPPHGMTQFCCPPVCGEMLHRMCDLIECVGERDCRVAADEDRKFREEHLPR